MARSLKKGPFCDDHLMKKVEVAKGEQKSHSNVVTPLNHFPTVCWTYNRCL